MLMLVDALISYDHHDVTGAISRNVCDGLFAIANAINRLADARERSTAVAEAAHAEMIRKVDEASRAQLTMLMEEEGNA
jgi:hypothetical protein